MNKIENIHIIAICGTGMAALAGLLKKSGHRVSGSDQAIYPPMSTLLERDEITCKTGFSAAHIPPDTDCVIVGNAVSKDNTEVLEMLRRRLPYFSMSSAIAHYFLENKQSLVVSGTHGKTTTSSLLAAVLSSAGRDPSALIGGWVKNFDSNHRIGKGQTFVIEGDEYDTAYFDKGPKFLHYRPQHAILTSIEFDHADIFKDLSSILAVFQKFVDLIPASGFLIAASGSPEIDQITEKLSCRVERYTVEQLNKPLVSDADWQAHNIKQEEQLLSFEVSYHGQKLGVIKSPLIGRHNLNNTLAVIALCHHLGLSWPEIQFGITSFKGIKKRQEIVGCVNDILIMDDFAHHPTAIFETLSALRLRYPTRRLWAIFEPRSATSRRNIFQDAFAEAFKVADCIVLADLFKPEKIPKNERLSPLDLVNELQQAGRVAYFKANADEIVSQISTDLKPGDLVCVMSSGGFDGLHQKLVSALDVYFSTQPRL